MSPPSASYLPALNVIVSDEGDAQSAAHPVVVDEPSPRRHRNRKCNRTLGSNSPKCGGSVGSSIYVFRVVLGAVCLPKPAPGFMGGGKW